MLLSRTAQQAIPNKRNKTTIARLGAVRKTGCSSHAFQYLKKWHACPGSTFFFRLPIFLFSNFQITLLSIIPNIWPFLVGIVNQGGPKTWIPEQGEILEVLVLSAIHYLIASQPNSLIAQQPYSLVASQLHSLIVQQPNSLITKQLDSLMHA